MGRKKNTNKYLLAEAKAILDAEEAYRKALIELQEKCAHRAILEHVDSHYEMFRVCEDCGTTCRAAWSSSVHAYGNMAIFSGRAYKVGWTEFAQATPHIGRWCQRSDEPSVFRRGGKKKVKTDD